MDSSKKQGRRLASQNQLILCTHDSQTHLMFLLLQSLWCSLSQQL